MIRRMALAFIGVLWASTAQAQECGQCEPQRVQCQQQAYNAQQSCNAPYYGYYTNCLSNAEAYRSACFEGCNVYCFYCNWQADGYAQQCGIQYNSDTSYCQTAYDATTNMCWQTYNECFQANCNNVADLSAVSGGGASLWNAPLAASGASGDVSASERTPAIATPVAEL